MIDQVTNFFLGNPQERKTLQRAKRVESNHRPTPRDRETSRGARVISRRLMLRRAAGIGGAALATGLGLLAFSEVTKDTTFEVDYLHYLQGFETVAQGDEQATDLLGFFKERRKRGKLLGSRVFEDEPGERNFHFYTAMVDPISNRVSFDDLRGFADFYYDTSTPRLLLKRVPITQLWAGVVLAHEGLHIYQGLSGIEAQRQDGFIIGEQEAYDLEIKLLNNQTRGRLKDVLRQITADAPEGAYRVRLAEDDRKLLFPLFPPSLSRDEDGVRTPALIIAANFVIAERRQDSSQAKVLEAKREYIRALFSGRVGMSK